MIASITSGTRSAGVRQAYRNPARTCPGWRATGLPRRSSPTRMIASAPITARNDAALKKKHGATPTLAISTAPMAGPMMREELMITEFSPTALATSSGPTISYRKLCCEAMPRAIAVPVRPARTQTIQTVTTSVTARTPSASASAAATDCVPISSLRLSTRSASAPPHAPKTSTGPNWSPTVIPRSTALPVRLSTSQFWAIDCIQVPLMDTTWLKKNSR